MELKVSESLLKKGVELDITSHRDSPRAFKLSIRFNEMYQRYEVFKHFYRTKKNEVEYHSKNLRDIVEYIKAMYGVDIQIEEPTE